LNIKSPTTYSKDDDPEPMSESDDEDNNLVEESKFTGHTKPMSEIESEFNDEDDDSDDED